MESKVVVTGLGAVTPCGNSVDTLWDSLVNTRSGINKIQGFSSEEYGYKVYVAGQVKDLDEESRINKKVIRRNDNFVNYALYAAYEAIHQAKLNDGSIDLDRVGVIVGSGIGGVQGFVTNVMSLYHGNGTVSPFLIPRVITDMASGMISIEYGFSGPNYSISSACATGNHAILNAYHSIRRGEADAIVTGGTEGAISLLTVCGFASAQALSANPDPERACRPWDLNRDGFIIGEGAGIVVLETEESAKRRGVPIIAEIVGGGMSADAYHITAPHPEGKGAIISMNTAIQSARIKKEEITYINAHGTSTPLGDLAETKAIKGVFGEHAYNIAVNSTKSMTGHLIAAAGGVEAIACIKTLQTGIVHPTANLVDPDPECDLNYVPLKAQKHDVKYALSNSFGFGGHNCSLIFKKYEN
jgi:3-oxoacyl-[acyl-carrier-protein] synthase II